MCAGSLHLGVLASVNSVPGVVDLLAGVSRR